MLCDNKKPLTSINVRAKHNPHYSSNKNPQPQPVFSI